MNEQMLRQELEKVSARYRRLVFWIALAAFWLALALGGLAVLAWARGASRAIPGAALLLLIALPIVIIPILVATMRKIRNPHWLAHRIEKRFPDLDARLLAALEQKPDEKTRQLGFLQETVIAQAVDHALAHGWEGIVSKGHLRTAKVAQWALLATFCIVMGTLGIDLLRHPSPGQFMLGGTIDRNQPYAIKVEPEDTDIERGSRLIVMARFQGRLPGDVQLLYHDAEGNVQQASMSKSLNDPLFAATVPSVNKDTTYAVRYGENDQTRWYKVGVFDYPELKQADAKLKFPEYTGQSEKVIEDTRSITAVEGTNATFTFRLNKSVTQAQLLPKNKPTTNPETAAAEPTGPVKLTVDPNDPTVYTAAFDLKQSQRFQLDLLDANGRKMKQAPELVLNVIANKPPEVQLSWPGRDIDASPLQELNLKAKVFDDFGVKRVGMTYSMAGKDPQDVVLGQDIKAKERKEVTQLVSLEKLSAEPDQLLTYYFWAEDVAADGSVRRTSGDMFFAEVRPFEEIFRQGQQPAAGQQQQQQQQQQNQQGNQNAQDAEQLADLQKQIIAATWKIIRRENATKPTPLLASDAKTVSDSQGAAREQASGLEERLTDEKSQAYLKNVYKYMEQAKSQLDKAATGNTVESLNPALVAEQAAYQELLKLRAREFEVTRQNRQQQQGQQRSQASNRRQGQLNQLDLEQEENRYETQRNAAAQQQQQQEQDPAQRETRQVLNRLRELAQRQEDLNRQMREIQSALQQAREQAQREDLERQLARLRDQQQQQLWDTDALRDRMDQPENQERMAESRQELEQTRDEVRKASEALDQQRVADAAAAGARAGEQLNNLRDQFRKESSGQFTDAVNQLREDARQLDTKQQQLSQQLANLPTPGRPQQNPQANPQQPGQPPQASTLRDSGERQQVVQDLQQQKEQLDKLMENMRKTIEEAETPEPLLSKQLYDTVRQATQQQPDKALDATKQLLDRGFTNEARQAETEAGKGITQLRQGIEQAARSVVGDDTESLRRARDELDNLAQQLDRELGRNQQAGANGQPATRPGSDARQLAQAGRGPTTRSGQGDNQPQQDGEPGQQPGEQQANDQQNGQGQQPGGQQQANAQQPGGQRGGRNGQQQNGQQPGGQQPGQQQGAGQQGQQGQQGQGEGQQGQARGGQRGQQGQQGQGQQGQAGAGNEGNQPGDQQARAGGRQGGNRAGGQRGGNGQAQQDGQDQQADQQANGQQPGGRQGGRQGLRGPRGGQAQDGQPSDQQAQDDQNPQAGQVQGEQQGQAQARGGRNGGRQGGNRAGGNGDNQQLAGNPNGDNGGANVDRQIGRGGPFTGGNFRDWSDRLRDVEEMVNDPELRQRAAQIRDRATAIRQDVVRHSEPPNRNVVEDMISKPLAELRAAVNDELLKRQSAEALVPIDREPVPPEYAEQVRRYYERLGSGK